MQASYVQCVVAAQIVSEGLVQCCVPGRLTLVPPFGEPLIQQALANNLVHLCLRQPLAEQALIGIGRLTKLTSMALMLGNVDVQMQAPAAPGFASLQQLQHMCLSGSGSGTVNLAHLNLSSLTALTKAIFNSVQGSLAAAATCKSLCSLACNGVYDTLDNTALAALRTLTSLHTFSCYGGAIGDELEAFSHLPCLIELHGDCLTIEPEMEGSFFQILGRFTSLRTLSLTECRSVAQMPCTCGCPCIAGIDGPRFRTEYTTAYLHSSAGRAESAT